QPRIAVDRAFRIGTSQAERVPPDGRAWAAWAPRSRARRMHVVNGSGIGAVARPAPRRDPPDLPQGGGTWFVSALTGYSKAVVRFSRIGTSPGTLGLRGLSKTTW